MIEQIFVEGTGKPIKFGKKDVKKLEHNIFITTGSPSFAAKTVIVFEIPWRKLYDGLPRTDIYNFVASICRKHCRKIVAITTCANGDTYFRQKGIDIAYEKAELAFSKMKARILEDVYIDLRKDIRVVDVLITQCDDNICNVQDRLEDMKA